MFDQLKNQLAEQKAWATSLEAKAARAWLVALTHNSPDFILPWFYMIAANCQG